MAEEELTSLDKEKLTLTDEQVWDQSSRAEAVLEHILKAEASKDLAGQDSERMTVAEAIRARPVLDRDTGRDRARVLFVTTDEQALVPDSALRRDYAELAKQFDEVHVFCLVPRSGQETFDRAGDNLWFYQIRAKHWWQLPSAAKAAAKEALVWNKVVRPDVIVGIDPFEAGLAAHLIAKSFARPLQLHIHTDPFTEDYLKAALDNNWRRRIARYLLRRVKSVRTATASLQAAIEKRYRRLYDVATLPRFYNFTGLLTAAPAFDLHQRYPDMVFIILAFGPLTADSYLHDLFSALNRLLRNPRIGLVVVGDGPAGALFEEKVKLLGIERNVVFKKEPEDLASYLKTANLLVEMSTAEDGEVRVLQAAAAGLPAVMYATDLRRDLFKDGESGFIVEPGDLSGVYQKTSKFINGASLRSQFSENASNIARDRLREDPAAHYQAIALTIESVLVAAEGNGK